MNNFKTLLAMVVIASACCLAMVATSCHRDKCAGVSCRNGGACSGGQCKCPTGYSGKNCEFSSVDLKNNTFTTVLITIGTSHDSVLAGATKSFVGTAGTPFRATASATGQYGVTYDWNIGDTFPSDGAQTSIPLDIGADYFFLKVSNVAVLPINYLTVNLGTAYQTVETVLFPADRYPYGAGYYNTLTSTIFRVGLSNGSQVYDTVSVSPGINASYTLIVN